MKSLRLLLMPQALADLDGIHDYIAESSPTNADSFVKSLLDHFASRAASGASFQAKPQYGSGRFTIPHGRFTAIYEVSADHLRILRIFGGQDIAAHLGVVEHEDERDDEDER